LEAGIIFKSDLSKLKQHLKCEPQFEAILISNVISALFCSKVRSSEEHFVETSIVGGSF